MILFFNNVDIVMRMLLFLEAILLSLPMRVPCSTSTDSFLRDFPEEIVVSNKSPFSQQITVENVRYVIRDKIIVGGTETKPVALPRNVDIYFDGGALCDGFLEGNNTNLSGNENCRFMNLVLSGSFSVDYFSPEMFVGKSDDICINAAIAAAECGVGRVLLKPKEYTISSSIVIRKPLFFGTVFNRGPYNFGTRTIISSRGDFPLIDLIIDEKEICAGLTLENFELRGRGYKKEESIGIKYSSTKLFELNHLRNLFITNVRYGIEFISPGGIGYNNFEDVKIQECLIGMRIKGNEKTSWMNNNTFIRCTFIRLGICGVHLRGLKSIQTNTFLNCTFEDIGSFCFSKDDYNHFGGVQGYSAEGGSNINTFQSCYFEKIYPSKSIIPVDSGKKNRRNTVLEVINGTGIKVDNSIISSFYSIYLINGYGSVLTDHNFYGKLSSGDKKCGLITLIVKGYVHYNTIDVNEYGGSLNNIGYVDRTFNWCGGPDNKEYQLSNLKTMRYSVFTDYPGDVYVQNALERSGDSSSRPTGAMLKIGMHYFDTTIGKPIYWNGSNWVDALGNKVR